MEKQPEPAPKSLVQWAMTPPQSYAVYFICVILIGGLSFYAGTLRPKKTVGMPPQITSVPRN
jgi:hypothetical protein